jgi:hypothetical protein
MKKIFLFLFFNALLYNIIYCQRDSIVLTNNCQDLNNLQFIDTIKVTEKWFFYDNYIMKDKTINLLKDKAHNLDGDVVYIDISNKKGWGLLYSTTYIGYVYKKRQ